MAFEVCTCKYRWHLINYYCAGCGRMVVTEKWESKPQPPGTFDEMADLIHYLMHGPEPTQNIAEAPERSCATCKEEGCSRISPDGDRPSLEDVCEDWHG
jgi:hypothetical protein